MTREHRENLVKNAKILFDKTKTQLTSLHNKHTKKVNSVKSKHSEDLIRNINNTVSISRLEEHIMFRVGYMVFNATFNNISVISWV